MSNRKSLLTLAMICVLVGVLSSGPVLADDKAEVKAALGGFYDALHAHFTGEFEPMEKVWSHASDITYLSPSGDIKIGWEQVGPTWKALAAMKMGGKIKPEGIHIILGADIAIVTNRQVGKAHGEKVDIRATTIFRKEDGKWLMIGHHADPLAFLQQE